MNITTTIPDETIPAWQARVDQYNSGSNQPPASIEQFCQIMLDEETAVHVAAELENKKLAMAANARLMALGAAVMTQPDKLDDIEAAVLPILNA